MMNHKLYDQQHVISIITEFSSKDSRSKRRRRQPLKIKFLSNHCWRLTLLLVLLSLIHSDVVFVVVVAEEGESSSTTSSSSPLLPCINSETDELLNGKFIENGKCVDDTIFYYDLRSAPITGNGLHAGAPTHLHLWFGSLGNPVEDAFDPRNYGLYISGDKGKLMIDLSAHFIYDRIANRPAQPLNVIELATQPANILYPSPCELDYSEIQGQIYCSGWTSRIASPTNVNRIEVIAPDGLFGRRALEIGLKFFHLHPPFQPGNLGIYYNANGTCANINELYSSSASTSTSIEPIYCRFGTDCPGNATCVTADEPFTAAVTVTLLDREGNIRHKGTRYYTFDTEPAYVSHSSNTRLAGGFELVEAVDFQRVTPGTICQNVSKAEGSKLHSSGVPYAPRFYMFGPNLEANAFPQPRIDKLEANLTSSTTGILYDLGKQIGTFELVGPEGGDSIFIEENLGMISDGPGRFGGTLFALPVQAGNVLGKYTVKVTMMSGKTAMSNFIVIEDQSETKSNAPCSLFLGATTAWWTMSTFLAFLFFLGLH